MVLCDCKSLNGDQTDEFVNPSFKIAALSLLCIFSGQDSCNLWWGIWSTFVVISCNTFSVYFLCKTYCACCRTDVSLWATKWKVKPLIKCFKVNICVAPYDVDTLHVRMHHFDSWLFGKETNTLAASVFDGRCYIGSVMISVKRPDLAFPGEEFPLVMNIYHMRAGHTSLTHSEHW